MNAPADRPPLSQELAEALASRFGSRFSVAAAVRLHHGKDESSHAPMPPDAYVSFPGLAFAYWMRLFTSFAGTGAPTTRITGDCASIVTPLVDRVLTATVNGTAITRRLFRGARVSCYLCHRGSGNIVVAFGGAVASNVSSTSFVRANSASAFLRSVMSAPIMVNPKNTSPSRVSG